MRKPGTHQHCLYLHDDVVKRLRGAAKHHKRSQSEIVEEALKTWFEVCDTLLVAERLFDGDSR